jgi:hypothetical protein
MSELLSRFITCNPITGLYWCPLSIRPSTFDLATFKTRKISLQAHPFPELILISDLRKLTLDEKLGSGVIIDIEPGSAKTLSLRECELIEELLTSFLFLFLFRNSNSLSPTQILKLKTASHSHVASYQDFFVFSRRFIRCPNAFVPTQSGRLESVRIGSILKTAPPVERKVFEKLTDLKIPCSVVEGAARVQVNSPPMSTKTQSILNLQGVSFNPPFKPESSTEPGHLSFLPQVLMAGSKSYLYTDDFILLRESIGNGLDQEQSVLGILTSYERNLFMAKMDARIGSLSSLIGFFPTTATFQGPAVVLSYSDLHTYNHWVFALLPRFWYRNRFPFLCDLPIIIPRLHSKFQLEYLELLGMRESSTVQFGPEEGVLVSDAYVPSLPEKPHVSDSTIRWLRESFIPKRAQVPIEYEEGIYYLARTDSSRREFVNEGELWDLLSRYGFLKVVWSEFSVCQQIALAHNARIVVAAHGSNLTNLVFCSPGLKLLELWPHCEGPDSIDWLSFMINRYAARHYAVVCPPFPGDNRPSNTRSQLAPLDEIEATLRLIFNEYK